MMYSYRLLNKTAMTGVDSRGKLHERYNTTVVFAFICS